MAEDYYATLEVGREASPEEIQSAYRKLARKYHPDLNPDDKRAKEKFQDVQNASTTPKNAKGTTAMAASTNRPAQADRAPLRGLTRVEIPTSISISKISSATNRAAAFLISSNSSLSEADSHASRLRRRAARTSNTR